MEFGKNTQNMSIFSPVDREGGGSVRKEEKISRNMGAYVDLVERGTRAIVEAFTEGYLRHVAAADPDEIYFKLVLFDYSTYPKPSSDAVIAFHEEMAEFSWEQKCIIRARISSCVSRRLVAVFSSLQYASPATWRPARPPDWDMRQYWFELVPDGGVECLALRLGYYSD